MKRQFLQSNALFGGITDEEIELIIPMLEEEHYSAGTFIIREGEDGDRLHFIMSGSVEVLKSINHENKTSHRQLAVLGPGDTFGEMELIDIQRRSASVRAIEDVSALTLSNKNMYKLYHLNLKTYTMIIMNIAREISRRLRHMDDLIANAICAEQSPQ